MNKFMVWMVASIVILIFSLIFLFYKESGEVDVNRTTQKSIGAALFLIGAILFVISFMFKK